MMTEDEEILQGLDLLGDWLDAKGYGEEAGLCTRAMDKINLLKAIASKAIREQIPLGEEITELRGMLLEFVKDPIHQLRMTDTGVFGPHFVLITKDHVYKVREKLGIPKDIPRPDQETIDKYWDEKIAAAAALKEKGDE